ncbi:MAG: hypothetical protein JRD89_13180 [Deltaproteobacteria bacterium]|nr:hypothetical protein [Deltaproteobacteria bacterium]
MKKTLKISEETHRELSKVVGYLRSINGGDKTFDDAIKFLIEEWRKTRRPTPID